MIPITGQQKKRTSGTDRNHRDSGVTTGVFYSYLYKRREDKESFKTLLNRDKKK